MDMVSDTTADWHHPEASTKQTNPLTNKDAANASADAIDASGSGDPQPSSQSRTQEGSCAAHAEDVIERIGLPPSRSLQTALAKAPATPDDSAEVDGPIASTIPQAQQSSAFSNELDDFLPAGQRVVLILVGLVGSGKVSTFFWIV